MNDFVNFITVSNETGQIISDETVFVTGDNAVELLTVHKAKGLEFDTVYILDAVDNNWRPTNQGRKAPANLPLQPNGDDLDDYARLMFVAITRAKRSLVVSSYRTDATGKDVLTSPLISSAIEFVDIQPDALPNAGSIIEQHLAWPHLESNDQKRLLASTIENFVLSASSLLDFLDVSNGGPELFFERHLLRLPQATTPNMAFGTAIHAALEEAQKLTNAGNFSIAKTLTQFDTILAEQTLPHHEYARYAKHGQALLTKLFGSDTFFIAKGGLAEQSLSDIHIDGAIVKGTLDRIDQRSDELVIIDYKTGKPLSSFTSRAAGQQVKAWRHRMQLTFYTLLAQHSSRFKRSARTVGQMWYVEANTPKELIREFEPTSQDIEHLQQLIKAVWPKIKSLNLPDIRNYSADIAGIQAFEDDLINGRI